MRVCGVSVFPPQMQEMFDMIMKHKRAMTEMQVMWEKAVRDHSHEYDSDEEVDQQAGTWEHRLRHMEMEKTRGKINEDSVQDFQNRDVSWVNYD